MLLKLFFFSFALRSTSAVAFVWAVAFGLTLLSSVSNVCLALSISVWVDAASIAFFALSRAASTCWFAVLFSSSVRCAMLLKLFFFSFALRVTSCFGISLPTGLTPLISLKPCCREFSTSLIFWALLIPSVARLANAFTFEVSPFFSTSDKFLLLVILLFLSLFACSICLRASSLNSVVVLECHWFTRNTSRPSCPRIPAA